jgi:hypothetical protein
LPKSRQVTLTAKVKRVIENVWVATIAIAGCPDDFVANEKKDAAIQWVRDIYGIEPEVSDE